MKVLIIGGGIGGLTTALSLEAAGIDVEVFEQASTIEALGVGINLQPNAVRELTELGLGDELKSVAIETSTLTYYNRLGQAIWSEPRGLAAGYAWPQYSIDRGDLHMILLAAVRARVGAHSVLTRHKLVSFEQTSGDVTANFIDRATGKPLPSHKGDVLIGSDGIHSAVRAHLYPGEGPPVSSGRIQWRVVVEAEPFLDGRTHVTIGSRNRRAVIYPISEKARQRGRSLINEGDRARGDEPNRASGCDPTTRREHVDAQVPCETRQNGVVRPRTRRHKRQQARPPQIDNTLAISLKLPPDGESPSAETDLGELHCRALPGRKPRHSDPERSIEEGFDRLHRGSH